MRAEYKRDVSHNYLILQGEEAVDTSSYQVRMLSGNVIPSVLNCRLQGIDGNTQFCYDITSRQSAAAFYEQKKVSGEDLKMIFGGFVRVMEDMAEYLMNPEQLLLCPEYMYLDLEKREVSFCCLPGYGEPVQEQFRKLTEYFLPRLDHQDPEAVMMGYGVYRRALEPGLQLENIKEVIYINCDRAAERQTAQKKTPDSAEPEERETFSEAGEAENEADWGEGMEEPASAGKTGSRKRLLFCGAGILVLLGALAAGYLGYLPWIPAAAVMAGAIVFLAAGAAVMLVSAKKQRKKEEGAEWRNKVKKEFAESEGKEDSTEGIASELRTGELDFSFERKNGDISGKSPFFDKKSVYDRKTEKPPEQKAEEIQETFGETVILSENRGKGPASLVSREAGEHATIYLDQELTVIGKLAGAADAVIPLTTVSRVHARIRRKETGYYLADLNSRNGTTVNGRMLRPDEEYELQDEDQVDFAQARYVFLK